MMSFFTDRPTMTREQMMRRTQLESYIRLIIRQDPNKLISMYDIMNGVNNCLVNETIANHSLLSIIQNMDDVFHEKVSGLYYLVPTGNRNHESFQTRMEGNFDSACREKIKRVIKNAPTMMSEASKRGEHIVTLEPLTAAEYNTPIIARAVCTVLKHMYNIDVFMTKEIDAHTIIQEQHPPFTEDNIRRYKENFYLCAELHSNEDQTRFRIVSQQQKQILTASEALTAPMEPVTNETTEQMETPEKLNHEDKSSSTEDIE